MKFRELDIRGVFEITLELNQDDRGHFSRLFCKDEFLLKTGVQIEFKQINLSFSKRLGQIRGLHYYNSGNEEYKMIKCTKGKIFDVCVDLRKSSSTYLKYISLELSEENNKYILIPPGCAHGFQTLTSGVEMLYFHTKLYNPIYDTGVNCFDPKININWPISNYQISERDRTLSFC